MEWKWESPGQASVGPVPISMGNGWEFKKRNFMEAVYGSHGMQFLSCLKMKEVATLEADTSTLTAGKRYRFPRNSGKPWEAEFPKRGGNFSRKKLGEGVEIGCKKPSVGSPAVLKEQN